MKNRVKEIILNPVSMFIIGLLTGFLVKEIDIHFYTQHFGMSLSDMFSKVGIWVLTGCLLYTSEKRVEIRPDFPRLPLYRLPGHRQDHLRQNPGQGGQLPLPAGRRPLQRLRDVHRHLSLIHI